MTKLERRKRFQITLSERAENILFQMKEKKGLSNSILIDLAIQEYYKNEVKEDDK